jgi:chromosome segregation ATPase
MIAPKMMIAAGALGVAALFGSQAYLDWSARNTMNTRLEELESQIQSIRAADEGRAVELAKAVEAVQERLGLAATDAQKAASVVRQEQVRESSALRKIIDEHAKNVDSLREQSDAKLAAVKQETTTHFDEVTGQVSTVKTDLETTKTDLATNRREIGDVRDSLGRQIARNADELAVLKRRGERDYYEFDITKAKAMERVAGIRLQLNRTDTKARKYDVTLQVDDKSLQKKGQLLNEPIQLLVGKDRIRYELVVNSIDKDRIRGYISTPKDTVVGGTLALQ